MLSQKIQQIFSNKFIRNVGWLGSAELVNRIFRLGTTVTLARIFSPEDYGVVAIIYTVFDFASILTLRGGIGAKIVQANEEDVAIISDTSYWLNWVLCGSVFIFQSITAFPIAYFYGNQQLILPIITVALIYLMYPMFLVQSALIERENRLKIIAICNASQSIISNIITVVLAILGMGVWAVVLAMVLSTPVWIIIICKNHDWRPPKFFSLKHWQAIANFGKNILMVDVLNRLMMNLDYLIVGRFLGINELGFYYFAFNAGSGITMNLVNTFMAPLFPHLCAARHSYQQLKERYFKSMKTIMVIVGTFVLFQSALAPFYVPIIFGEKWKTAVPILIIICLSVIPRAIKWGSTLLLNAMDKTHLVLYFDIVYTLIFAVSILIAVHWGIFWVAVAVLSCHLVLSSIFQIWSINYISGKSQNNLVEN